MELQGKVLAGFERLADVFKTLLWQKAKVHGISPLQIQILIFVSTHELDLCNVSYLAKEFNLTKPTVSDAVKSLFTKGYLDKDYSSSDNRRFSLLMTPIGQDLINEIKSYSNPIAEHINGIDENGLEVLFKLLSSLIFDLNKSGLIEVQRTCFGCQHYRGNKDNLHHCKLLERDLLTKEIRLDCPEYELI